MGEDAKYKGRTTKPVFWEVRTVQAQELPTFARMVRTPVAKIDGKWRNLLDVFPPGMSAHAVNDHFEDLGGAAAHEQAKTINGWYDQGDWMWVAVRYLVEEKSDMAEIGDALHRWRAVDLVEVQVPVPAPNLEEE